MNRVTFTRQLIFSVWRISTDSRIKYPMTSSTIKALNELHTGQIVNLLTWCQHASQLANISSHANTYFSILGLAFLMNFFFSFFRSWL